MKILHFLTSMLFIVSSLTAQASSSNICLIRPPAHRDLKQTGCEFTKEFVCADFYKTVGESTTSEIGLKCSSLSMEASPILSCAGFGATMTLAAWSKLDSDIQGAVLKSLPKTIKSLGKVGLTFLSGLGQALGAYQVIDILNTSLEKDKKCFEDVEQKEIAISFIAQQSENVKDAVSKSVSRETLDSLSFPQIYRDSDFIRNMPCQRLKEIAQSMKRKQDQVLGPLLAQGKIQSDPRIPRPMSDDDKGFFQYLANHQQCLSPAKQAEIFCNIGNLSVSVARLRKISNDYKKGVNSQVAFQQKMADLKRTTGIRPLQVQKLYIDESFFGEELGKSAFYLGRKVLYLRTEAERAPFKLTLAKGLVLDAKGAPFNTNGKKAIFVLDPQGNIYASTQAEYAKFHHSSLVAGGEVLMAGEIEVANGAIERFSRQSGHYLPGEAHSDFFRKYLLSNGISTQKITEDKVKFQAPDDDEGFWFPEN